MQGILTDKVGEESIEIITGMKVMTEAEMGTGLEKVNFSRSFSGDRNRSTSNRQSRSESRASMNRVRITCYKCREYDHFAKDCPTSIEEGELEQLQ